MQFCQKFYSSLICFGILLFFLSSVGIAADVNDSAGLSKGSASVVSENNSGIDLNYALEDFEFKSVNINANDYSVIDFAGEESHGPAGEPDLPSFVRFILIPPQSGVDINIKHISFRTESDHNILPRQPVTQIDAEQVDLQFGDRFNDKYARLVESADFDGFYPSEPVRIEKPAIMRGYRILPVVVYPVQWNPQTKELRVIENLDFELDFTSNLNRINIIDDPHRRKPSESVYKFVSNLVLNPPEPERDIGVRNGSIIYVMGGWGDVEDRLEPLIEWRRRMGWTVEIVNDVQPNNANSVKAAIQEAYEEWDIPPEMVVLCGDTPDNLNPNYPMAFWNMQRGGGHPYESDHNYTMLDGDDLLPEVAIGRLIFNNLNMLEDIVEKIVEYESDPFIGDNDQRGWQKRAAVVAGDSRSGLSSIDCCRWTKELLFRNDYDEVDELYWTPQNPRPNANNFIRQNFASGISFYLYRGWTFMSGFGHAEVDNLRNGRMLPFVMLATCNTGDYGEHTSSMFYYSERFLYNSRGGAIGAVGAAGATHTAYNNLIASGTFRNIFAENIPYQGWAFMNGKAELWTNYGYYDDDIHHEENPGLDGWECETYIFNLMGDPAVDLYTDVPHRIQVDHPNSLREGETHVEIEVLDADDNPLQGVKVCLYKPGDFQKLIYTDDEGLAVFDLDPDWTDRGEALLTVTGHNLTPYYRDLDIDQEDLFIGADEFDIDDDDQGESDGDGDGDAEPAERLEVVVAVKNFGSNVPQGQVQLELTPAMEHLEVVEGEAVLEEAPGEGQSAEVAFVVEIEGGFPAEMDAVFNLEATAGDDSWISSITIPIEGPVFEFVSLDWDDDPLVPGDVVDCRIRIRNVGDEASPDLTARLITLCPTIDVPEPDGNFPGMNIGASRRSENSFTLAANVFHIAGSNANLALILTTEAGLIDTAFFSFPVSQAGDGQPFGPDEYGYICLDDTDENWVNVPEYDWIEIDPHRHGRGTNTNLNDTREEGDASRTVDLPFNFVFYGEEYDEITVCTNGWIAMGDCSELIVGRNRKLPSGMAPPGLIAPFWDDLLTTNEGGVYYHFIEDDHIFIVEWSRMRRLGPRGGNEASETFQVILFDPEHYPSLTGDGDILFQYLDVTDDRSCFQQWDTPFATVGIGNPDQSTGLTYTYWGELSPGAAELEDERAIKFTTSVISAMGEIFGAVTDAATGEPIEEAIVTTSHGFVSVSDEEGAYRIENAPANVIFSLTASKDGYNDSTLADLQVEDDEELEINFGLLHPEFRITPDEVEESVLPGDQVEAGMSLVNEGSGVLNWAVERRNPGNADADPWERRSRLNIGELLDDARIGGVAFVGDHFYVSGGNTEDNFDTDRNLIYVLDRDYNLERTFQQFLPEDRSRYGMEDLTYDGELLWGGDDDMIFGFTTAGEMVHEFESPFHPTKNITWDTEQEVLWVSSTTSDFVAVDREGNEVDELDRKDFRIYGLTYWTEDPDGYNLYVFNRPRTSELLIHKMNTENGDTMFVAELEKIDNERPAGAFITPAFDVYSWVYMCIINDGSDDRLEVWQLDVRRDWMLIEPENGVLQAGEETDLTLTLSAVDMPQVELTGILEFDHNATGSPAIVDITFNIVNRIVREQTAPFVHGWNMISLNVSPPLEMYADEELPGPDVILMTEQMRIDEENHRLIIMKDQYGRFYLPAWGFNSIPCWNLEEGYQINITEDFETVWSGEPIEPDADIPLNDSWNMVPYYPTYDLDASNPDFYVVSNIVDNLLIAKDAFGQFMLPEFGFSNMEPWTAGQGYQLKIDGEGLVLNYPPEQEEGGVLASVDPSGIKEDNPIKRTGQNQSVLIHSLKNIQFENGDRIVAKTQDGMAIGSGYIRNQACGLAVWGDDQTTEEKDGLLDGETYRLCLESVNYPETVDLSVEKFHIGEELVYAKDGYLVIDVTGNQAVPGDYYLSEGFPNPFNSMVRLNYGLPQDGMVELSVFDLHGRLVETLIGESRQAGNYTATWNALDMASGLYWIKMKSDDFSKVRKVMLIK